MTRIKGFLAALTGRARPGKEPPETLYTFPAVAKWLNALTTEKGGITITFEPGATWIALKNGVQFRYLDKFGSIGNVITTRGEFEDAELALVQRNLPPQAVFFDVGANLGLYTLLVGRTLPTVEIHAFEPVPDTLQEFKDNLARNRIDPAKVHIVPAAVGASEGTLFITTEYHGSNYVTSATSDQNKVEVPCITLDDYIRREGIARLDFVKIDVEGTELSVLAGARQSLARFRPIVLLEIFEQRIDFHDRKICDYKQTIRFMLDMGYKYYVFDDRHELIHMDELDKGLFNWSYHNYVFYTDALK